MRHKYFEGSIYHKRYFPKEHQFEYGFYMLDMDVNSLSTLNNRWFSFEKFNLFSFKSEDHFGKTSDFKSNVHTLLKKFNIEKSKKIRFITLPRVLNFVFNPISLLIVFDDETNKAKYLLAEVHNYNGGRVIYPIKLQQRGSDFYKGEILKDMYVSPFFKRDGQYKFTFRYDESNVALKIDLFEQKRKMLSASFFGKSMHFTQENTIKLFLKHTFLTMFVVTRTLWQSLKLYLKGLKFNKVTNIDTKRRH